MSREFLQGISFIANDSFADVAGMLAKPCFLRTKVSSRIPEPHQPVPSAGHSTSAYGQYLVHSSQLRLVHAAHILVLQMRKWAQRVSVML